MREEEEPHEDREPEGTFLPGTPEAEREEVSRLHGGDQTPLIISACDITHTPGGQNDFIVVRPPKAARL